MSEPRLPSSDHVRTRARLRVAGVIVFAGGVVLTIIGMASFFSAFGSFEPPRYFWCAFVGMPLVVVGSVLLRAGFMGAWMRYFVEETAPVVKDTTNYLGENTQPGVKAVAKAITEGIKDGLRDDATR